MTVTVPDITNWTAAGANASAKGTYDIIANALRRSIPDRYQYDVFLQGSYANATNIRGNSDVDIVVMLTSTFYASTSRLTSTELSRYERERIPGGTSTTEWRQVVQRALRDSFRDDEVEARAKCIKVHGNGSRIDADVVPCMEYRDYTSYPAYGDREWLRGIKIVPTDGQSIINYPKEHIDNGRKKNGDAEHYKDTVRQIKRLKHWINEYASDNIDIPGYLIECMTYNLPGWLLSNGDDEERLALALVSFHRAEASELLNYVSCDEVHEVFVDDPGDHDVLAAQRQMRSMLNNLLGD